MTSDHVMCSCGQGRVVHAEYSGGEIVKGSIVAAVGDEGQLDMRCAEPPTGGLWSALVFSILASALASALPCTLASAFSSGHRCPGHECEPNPKLIAWTQVPARQRSG